MSQALLLSGGGGVGKTTIARAIGRLLTAERHPTAVLDLDAIAQVNDRAPEEVATEVLAAVGWRS